MPSPPIPNPEHPVSTSRTHTEQIRAHYTQVCHCEYADDDFTRVSTNTGCVVHGDVDDPLLAVEAQLVTLREERDQANDCIDALEKAMFDVATFHRETGALIGRSRDDLETRIEDLRRAEARVKALEEALRAVKHESTYRGPERLRHIARVALEADARACPGRTGGTPMSQDRSAPESRVGRLEQALRLVLDCKGPYDGTVSTHGGHPAICPTCANKIRAALATLDDPADGDDPLSDEREWRTPVAGRERQT